MKQSYHKIFQRIHIQQSLKTSAAIRRLRGDLAYGESAAIFFSCFVPVSVVTSTLKDLGGKVMQSCSDENEDCKITL